MATMIEPVEAVRASDGTVFAVDRAMRPVRMVFRAISLVLLLALIVLPALQIVLREFAGRLIIGAEELARFMLICLVFISLPHVVYAGASIRLEELIGMLPERALRATHAVIALVSAFVFLVGAFATIAAITGNLNTTTPTLRLPYWIFLASAFVGFVLAAVETAIVMVKVLKRQPPFVLYPSEQPSEDGLAL